MTNTFVFKAALVGGLMAMSNLSAAAMTDASAVQKGSEVYQVRCMHCHGENADGKGKLIDYLKVHPADLSQICHGESEGCITDLVLKAVLGRHSVGEKKMPVLKEYLNIDQVYYLSEFLKTKQR